MDNLAVYDGNLGIFNFNLEKLRNAGLELDVLKGDNTEKPSSQVTLDLLIFKAFKRYFEEEKVVSLDAIDCYVELLKKSSKLVDIIKENNYFLPHPINPKNFTQEQILEFYKQENFNPLLGMLAFIEKKYAKKFEKNY